MNYRESTYQAYDDKTIHYKIWLPPDEIKLKAVLQIAHGMAEHSGRYEEFATFLTNHGYGVYANDHIGHGKTAESSEELGFLAEEEGWQRVVKDMQQLTSLIKGQHPDTPIFILGHSMGSLLTRTYIQKYGKEVMGVILSGTSGKAGLSGELGLLICKLETIRLGKRGRSKLMDNLMFGGFNQGFEPTRTKFDWLTSDKIEVDKYIYDDFCGGVCTTSFYKDIILGLKEANSADGLKNIPKELPILIFSGEKDPVGKDGKGVTEVYEDYTSGGFDDVSLKLYKDGRHEMLNECNKEEVYRDILGWLDRVLAKSHVNL
ncbi:alpha/beta hydrolase [Alkaliphilus serpentinus]|uniref:Alpha/beta hydrolase n=1 Tax=Alkaliphilus serpentinus TaxID=1482731 RepID=A0A833HMQ3_9FIRM|nr:alpha/beta hydrolase [Alkaliphilus serpentinus]KAB3528834.1 alpha/beta hydrolase [Alkaliphilus serpentinus]